MFGWHPTVTTPDSKLSEKTIENKNPEADQKIFSIGVKKTEKKVETKAKRRRHRKSKARREFAKNMREMEAQLDNLLLKSQCNTKQSVCKEGQRETFISQIKSKRLSKILLLRGTFFNRECPAESENENLVENCVSLKMKK